MNDFFPKGELLAGLSEDQQSELRTHIGVTSMIEHLSNNSILTTSLNVTSNVTLDIATKGQGNYLKCVDGHSGLAQWQPLPVYQEVFDITFDSVKDRLYGEFDSVANLDVDCNLRLKSNLVNPSIITNSDNSGSFKWLTLQSNFPGSAEYSNNVPNMIALSNLYNQSKRDDEEVLSNLKTYLDDQAGLLIASNNLEDLQDKDLALSNLGLALKLHTGDVVAQNLHAGHLNATSAQIGTINSTEMIIENNLSTKSSFTSNAMVNGELIAESILASNVTITNALNISDSLNVNRSMISNLIASNAEFSNLMIHAGDDHDIMTVVDNIVTLKKLDSTYTNASETEIASSKAVFNAVQFFDSRLQNITNDPSFSQTYLAITKNLSEYEFATLDTILEIHSNLRLNKLAREGTWDNIENKPAELSLLSNTYMKRDFGNMDLGEIQTTILQESLNIRELAYMDKSNVDILDGIINVTKLQTENFVLNSNNNNVNTNLANDRDEVFLYLKHAGNEGANDSGTGKWTNLPIDQNYLSRKQNAIPSSLALSNLHKYVTNVTHITGCNIETIVLNSNSESNVLSNVITYLYFDGFLKSEFSNQTSEHHAASTKAVSDLYEYLRDSNGEGYIRDEYIYQPSSSKPVSGKALADVYHMFIDFSNYSLTKNSAATTVVDDLQDFMLSLIHI